MDILELLEEAEHKILNAILDGLGLATCAMKMLFRHEVQEVPVVGTEFIVEQILETGGPALVLRIAVKAVRVASPAGIGAEVGELAAETILHLAKVNDKKAEEATELAGAVGGGALVGAAIGGPIGAGVGAGVGFLSWGAGVLFDITWELISDEDKKRD